MSIYDFSVKLAYPRHFLLLKYMYLYQASDDICVLGVSIFASFYDFF